MTITIETFDDVAVIRFANPPLNALVGDVRGRLIQALADIADNPTVRVVVLTAEGQDFCTGLDNGTAKPTLLELCNRIERFPKPVIAALQGAVLGDGLDVAVACHYRVGGRDVRLGAPGLRLGLPPRGGASQRLPRLIGAAASLALFLGGTTRAPAPGFLDAPLADDPVEAARALAQDTRSPRPTADVATGLADANAFMATIAKARTAAEAAPIEATARLVACVEGAVLLPLDTGLAMEQAAYDDCVGGPAHLALRHISEAEAKAWELPEAAGGRVQPFGQVAIVGGTPRAGELAFSCLDAGLNVTLIELDSAGQAAVLERLLALYDDAVARGTLSAEERDARLLRINPDGTFDDVPQMDMVWEAAADNPVLRRELWAAIALLARPGAVLIACGDTMALGDLAGEGGRLSDMVGLHCPGAAHLGGLMELTAAPGVNADAAATALALIRRLHRQVVRAPDHPGRLVHHLSETLEQVIEALLVAGRTAEDIDEALTAYGFRYAPCASMDMRGLDRVLDHRRAVHGDDTPQIAVLDALVDSGLTGRGAGAGLLAWRDGVPMGEPADTRAMLHALAEAGVPQSHGVAGDNIAFVCAAALADAGAKLLEAGLVDRASDVDVAAVHGLGFPRWRGGPMAAADQRGLVRVEREATQTGQTSPVSTLFAECIKNGTRLAARKADTA